MAEAIWDNPALLVSCGDGQRTGSRFQFGHMKTLGKRLPDKDDDRGETYRSNMTVERICQAVNVL